MATPGFMFTLSSEISPQVNCVSSTLKVLWTLSLRAHVTAECTRSFTSTALAFTSARSVFSKSAPARTPSALQPLQGVLIHVNLTTLVPQGDLITQPALTWTSLSCIPWKECPKHLMTRHFNKAYWCGKNKTHLCLCSEWGPQRRPACKICFKSQVDIIIQCSLVKHWEEKVDCKSVQGHQVWRIISVTEKEPVSYSAGLRVGSGGKLNVQSRAVGCVSESSCSLVTSWQPVGKPWALRKETAHSAVQDSPLLFCYAMPVFVIVLICTKLCIIRPWVMAVLFPGVCHNGSMVWTMYWKKKELVFFKLQRAHFSSIYSNVLSKSSVCIIIISM